MFSNTRRGRTHVLLSPSTELFSLFCWFSTFGNTWGEFDLLFGKVEGQLYKKKMNVQPGRRRAWWENRQWKLAWSLQGGRKKNCLWFNLGLILCFVCARVMLLPSSWVPAGSKKSSNCQVSGSQHTTANSSPHSPPPAPSHVAKWEINSEIHEYSIH